MDDRLERARRALQAAEADFDRSVRWLAWSAVLVVLSFSTLLASRLHWLPEEITRTCAVGIAAAALLILVPALRWMWTNRPWSRRRSR